MATHTLAAQQLRRVELLSRHVQGAEMDLFSGRKPPGRGANLHKAPAAAASGQRGWDMSDEELYMFVSLRVHGRSSVQARMCRHVA